MFHLLFLVQYLYSVIVVAQFRLYRVIYSHVYLFVFIYIVMWFVSVYALINIFTNAFNTFSRKIFAYINNLMLFLRRFPANILVAREQRYEGNI